MEQDQVIDHFNRTPTEEVRATLRTFRGKRYMDVRVYYLDDEGEYRPTKKGVNLSVDFLPELTGMIEKLAKAVVEAGATPPEPAPEKPARKRRAVPPSPEKAEPTA